MWLIDWLTDTWNWITTGLTFANFVMLVTIVVKWWTNRKTNKLNNQALTNLSKGLSDIIGTKDTIDSNNTIVSNLIDRINTLESNIIESNRRLGCVIDIMTVTYLRSKDEDVRKAVSNIVSTFKYADNKALVDLQTEVAALKEELKTANEMINSTAKNEDVNVVHGDDEVEEVEEIVLRG